MDPAQGPLFKTQGYLDALNELRAANRLPPLEAEDTSIYREALETFDSSADPSTMPEDWLYHGDLAQTPESGIMESPDALEEDGRGADDAGGPDGSKIEGAGETAKVGDDFGKLGTMVENPGLKADWTNTTAHGKERMAQRGVTQSMVDAWMEGGKVLVQNNGNYIYITKEGVAVFNSSGKLVTTYTSKDYDDSMRVVVRQLFGE